MKTLLNPHRHVQPKTQEIREDNSKHRQGDGDGVSELMVSVYLQNFNSYYQGGWNMKKQFNRIDKMEATEMYV